MKGITPDVAIPQIIYDYGYKEVKVCVLIGYSLILNKARYRKTSIEYNSETNTWKVGHTCTDCYEPDYIPNKTLDEAVALMIDVNKEDVITDGLQSIVNDILNTNDN